MQEVACAVIAIVVAILLFAACQMEKDSLCRDRYGADYHAQRYSSTATIICVAPNGDLKGL